MWLYRCYLRPLFYDILLFMCLEAAKKQTNLRNLLRIWYDNGQPSATLQNSAELRSFLAEKIGADAMTTVELELNIKLSQPAADSPVNSLPQLELDSSATNSVYVEVDQRQQQQLAARRASDATEQEALGNYKAAIALWQEAVKLDPGIEDYKLRLEAAQDLLATQIAALIAEGRQALSRNDFANATSRLEEAKRQRASLSEVDPL
jgi:hypothetical protein